MITVASNNGIFLLVELLMKLEVECVEIVTFAWRTWCNKLIYGVIIVVVFVGNVPMIMRSFIVGDANILVGVPSRRSLVFTNGEFKFIDLSATMVINAVIVSHSAILAVLVTVKPCQRLPSTNVSGVGNGLVLFPYCQIKSDDAVATVLRSVIGI